VRYLQSRADNPKRNARYLQKLILSCKRDYHTHFTWTHHLYPPCTLHRLTTKELKLTDMSLPHTTGFRRPSETASHAADLRWKLTLFNWNVTDFNSNLITFIHGRSLDFFSPLEEKCSQKIYLQPLLVGLLRKNKHFKTILIFVTVSYISLLGSLFIWGGGRCPIHLSSINPLFDLRC
jgi:hypothetical protein